MEKTIDRRLVRTLLDHIILEELAKRPIHGYEIISLLRRRFKFYYGPSTVYPVLSMLRKEGLVKSAWTVKNGRPRKIYTLTGVGKAALEKQRVLLSSIAQLFPTTLPFSRKSGLTVKA